VRESVLTFFFMTMIAGSAASAQANAAPARSQVRCGDSVITSTRPPQSVPVRDAGVLARTRASDRAPHVANVDSLYGAARSLLARQRYGDAVSAFEALVEGAPTTLYAPNALYWAAYALHRRGIDSSNAADLQLACLAIARLEAWYPDAVIHGDAMGLLVRINAARGSLARRPPG
jgi:TolA-binding protein